MIGQWGLNPLISTDIESLFSFSRWPRKIILVDLVGGAIAILKNMKVNGKDDIPYMKWKIKVMFETTNQIMFMQSYAAKAERRWNNTRSGRRSDRRRMASRLAPASSHNSHRLYMGMVQNLLPYLGEPSNGIRLLYYPWFIHLVYLLSV